ncbi:vWA domain-containing protein [Haloarchaeobius sp. HRN-SO-5]|uniref:vWA domain-containing protein n=1 Tax=Haloarchaeobius sp. HRN-SO-5 TaxID=3446118 RepID=UPI003EB73AE9
MAGDPPDFVAARDHVVQQVVDFARRLRAEGVSVPANAGLPATEALAQVGLDDRERVRAAMHATLVTDPRDSETFDELFPGFWYRLRTGLEAAAAHDGVGDRADDAADGEGLAGPDVEGALADASLATTLDETDELAEGEGEVASRRIAETDADAADVTETDRRPGTYSAASDRAPVRDETVGESVDRATMRRFERVLATLPGRRWARSRTGTTVDARRALRGSLDTGGVVLSLPRRERDLSAFRTCVLVDVSRSVLDAIDRGFLLSFLDALVAEGRSVRVFFFDTDIQEVTDVFESTRGDPATALERAEVAWGGGTRIGSSLATLRERWPHAVDRRTVTLVVSDGLDVGDVADLEAGMSWLASHSGSVLWLNPLAASVRYEPTCRGMDAALPYVDGLFAFGGPADVAEVARQLERYGPGGSVGYQHDFRDRRGVSTG